MRKHFTFNDSLFKHSDFLKKIQEFVKDKDRQDAQVGDHTSKKGSVKRSESRRSRLVWLPNNGRFREFLWNHVEEMNRKFYNFDVTRCCDIQYTEYHGSEEGHYNWHNDVHFMNDVVYDRKISVTVQLSDPSEYEGGDFEIAHVPLPDGIKNFGSVLTFPSYMQHRVAPVTKGVRKSLVAWFEGPRWR